MYQLLPNTHVLVQADYHPSPNCSPRIDIHDISLIVVHNISLPPNQFGGSGVLDFFQNKLDESVHPYYQTIAHIKVSAHLFLRREGQLIQFVPFHLQAWHAGQSSFLGRPRCNAFSIGIELEGSDAVPYTEKQYLALAKICLFLKKQYVNIEHIVGHSDIALPKGRKTDPGPAFNWDKLNQMMSCQG